MEEDVDTIRLRVTGDFASVGTRLGNDLVNDAYASNCDVNEAGQWEGAVATAATVGATGGGRGVVDAAIQ